MASNSPRRVVILTGEAQGIGRGIALRLANDGFDLGLFDLPQCEDLLEDVAAEIRKAHGVRVSTIYGDVSVEEDVKRFVGTVVRELGDVYAMIANGAICTLHETPTETVDKLLSTNIKGVFLCYKYAAIRMIEQGKGGRIIGATSSTGSFAVRGLTQSAAMEYGKYGTTVNAYGPGAFQNVLGKYGEPEDIAKLVSFLISDDASFIPGNW
ncbi:acetoin reductase family protein [Ganoderma leucocontextum]|nr:acetoin reductase family protein [Ganoderma leucocontextum]